MTSISKLIRALLLLAAFAALLFLWGCYGWIDADGIERAQQICANHGGVKAVAGAVGGARDLPQVACVDGTKIDLYAWKDSK